METDTSPKQANCKECNARIKTDGSDTCPTCEVIRKFGDAINRLPVEDDVNQPAQ